MIGGNSYITIFILLPESEPVFVYCPTLNYEYAQKLFTLKKPQQHNKASESHKQSSYLRNFLMSVASDGGFWPLPI